MSEIVDVEVPTVGESITEVQLGVWMKAEGDWVDSGEDLVEIETEKATVQLPSPAAGFLQDISKQAEDFANVGDVIAKIRVAERPAVDGASPAASKAPAIASSDDAPADASFVMPAAQRLLDEHGLSASEVPATGPGGRLLKEDVLKFLDSRRSSESSKTTPAPSQSTAPPQSTAVSVPAKPSSTLMTGAPDRSEEVKPLSMLRRTIASRLVNAQQTAALLTTFNEIDMQPVMSLRKKYKDAFLENMV